MTDSRLEGDEEPPVLPVVSVVIPAFNEEACLPELLSRLDALAEGESGYRFDVLVVENGSQDRSREILEAATARYGWLRYMSLSRNFDIEGAMLAGLDNIDGDVCVLLNADLEDPPELISDFLRRWESGSVNVVGEVVGRPGYSRLRQWLSLRYYAVAARFTHGAIQRNISDFRLMDRRVYTPLRAMREFERLNRGLVGWLGFASDRVPYERAPRFAGKSNFRMAGAAMWGVRHIMGFTVTPLRVVSAIGVALFMLSLFAIVVSAIRFVFWGVPFSGFGTIIGAMLLLFGLNFILLGVFGEYLAVIFQELKARPRYVVDSASWEGTVRGGGE